MMNNINTLLLFLFLSPVLHAADDEEPPKPPVPTQEEKNDYIDSVDTDFTDYSESKTEQLNSRLEAINEQLEELEDDEFNDNHQNATRNQNLVNRNTAGAAVAGAVGYSVSPESPIQSTNPVNTDVSDVNSSYSDQRQELAQSESENPSEVSNDSSKINTVDIVTSTMQSAMSCMKWQVRGICVWMTCTAIPPSCSFDSSIKVKNFAPEMVFQSYDNALAEPWSESQYVNKMIMADADSSWVKKLIEVAMDVDLSGVKIRGGVSTESTEDKKASLSYKLVDAYGHPAVEAFNQMADSTGNICKGGATMFNPYYISNLDAISWRWNIPETFYPQSFNVVTNHFDLGSYYNNYGAIYPRHGFMTSQDPLKAAVLSAYRAAHFITRSGTPHIYQPFTVSSRQGYWPPGSLDQNNSDTGVWQMLVPQKDSSCARFPYGGNPSAARRSTDGSYVWNFWRAYKCCERKGQTLIFHSG